MAWLKGIVNRNFQMASCRDAGPAIPGDVSVTGVDPVDQRRAVYPQRAGAVGRRFPFPPRESNGADSGPPGARIGRLRQSLGNPSADRARVDAEMLGRLHMRSEVDSRQPARLVLMRATGPIGGLVQSLHDPSAGGRRGDSVELPHLVMSPEFPPVKTMRPSGPQWRGVQSPVNPSAGGRGGDSVELPHLGQRPEFPSAELIWASPVSSLRHFASSPTDAPSRQAIPHPAACQGAAQGPDISQTAIASAMGVPVASPEANPAIRI